MIDSVSSFDSQTETRLVSAHARRRRLRNRLMAAVLLLLIAVVIVPPFININRFRRSIVRSIGAGLGRHVEASSVELQLFPIPGFVLHNLTVSEDPSFGAEPVMTADTVTAVLRASTLWHRRVEIATLRVHHASLNLVRNAQGRWNCENLLVNSPALRKRHATPDTEPVSFPYVEATETRINFKRGTEKLPFSLESANLALWKQSSHEWRVRIRARPVRTDLSVANAGEIRGAGTLVSSPTLMNDPVYVRLEWRRVQLGEITRLLHGEDEGWRGTVDWTARAIGTLADVSVISDAAVQEFHRTEFVPASQMDLSAHCAGRYAHDNPKLDSLTCNAPLGTGQLLLRGRFPEPHLADASLIASLPAKKSRPTRLLSADAQSQSTPASVTSVQIALRRVPASFFLDIFSHIHPGVSRDATVSGRVEGNANCRWSGWNTLSTCTGKLQSTELRLRLPNLERPLTFSSLQLVSSQMGTQLDNGPESAIFWKFSPTHVALGGPVAATFSGKVNSSGALLTIDGPADLSELKALASPLNVPVFFGAVQHIRGSAQLALSLQTFWIPGIHSGPVSILGPENLPTTANFSPIAPLSQWSGSLRVQNATLRMASLPIDVQLASAQVILLPATMQWIDLKGTVAHIPFDGSFIWQLSCPGTLPGCVHQFSLHTENLNVGHLQSALTHTGNSSDLLHLIDTWTGASSDLPQMTGMLNADVLSLGKISVKNAALKLQVHDHHAELLSVSGKIFNGSLSGEDLPQPADSEPAKAQQGIGSIQWGNGAPAYALRLNLEHIHPNRVAAIWHENWGPGTANLKLDIKMQGWSASELAQSVGGKFSVAWLNGGLPNADAASTGSESLKKFQLWDAKGTIRDRKIVLGTSRIVPAISPPGHLAEPALFAATQSVTGTINFSRVLDLKLHPSGISIRGPIDLPLIAGTKSFENSAGQAQ